MLVFLKNVQSKKHFKNIPFTFPGTLKYSTFYENFPVSCDIYRISVYCISSVNEIWFKSWVIFCNIVGAFVIGMVSWDVFDGQNFAFNSGYK